MDCLPLCYPDCFFFFNATATTEIYTLSLHDALPIFVEPEVVADLVDHDIPHEVGHLLGVGAVFLDGPLVDGRSEEHTSELQSLRHLVCRLLLEKKKNKNTIIYTLDSE